MDEPISSDSEQLDLLSDEERVNREVKVILGRHHLLTTEGSHSLTAIADLVYPTISQAVVESPGDRTKVGITPTHLMEQFFEDVPGPANWAEYEDEDEAWFHERVYKAIKGEVLRVLSIQPDGLVQSRLGTNGGLVLCRTPARKGGREEVAYVTRHRKCIDEDNNTPAVKKAQNAMAKAAGLTAMSVERVPEHGRWFHSQYNAGMKEAIESGKNKIQAALEASTEPEDSE
jgi:hypothetical protein